MDVRRDCSGARFRLDRITRSPGHHQPHQRRPRHRHHPPPLQRNHPIKENNRVHAFVSVACVLWMRGEFGQQRGDHGALPRGFFGALLRIQAVGLEPDGPRIVHARDLCRVSNAPRLLSQIRNII